MGEDILMGEGGRQLIVNHMAKKALELRRLNLSDISFGGAMDTFY